jgi:hypothetical protein
MNRMLKISDRVSLALFNVVVFCVVSAAIVQSLIQYA